jgi:hypothetical protein
MQGCWVHKTANILNKLPNSLHGKAKRALHNIWMSMCYDDKTSTAVYAKRVTLSDRR